MRITAKPAFEWASSNPYNSILYNSLVYNHRARVSEFKFAKFNISDDIVHIHWPDLSWDGQSWLKSFLRGCSLIVDLCFRKALGAKVVWTAHNVFSHEDRHPALRKMFWPLLDQIIDATILLNEASRELVFRSHPVLKYKPSKIIYHGHYGPVLRPGLTKTDARTSLGITGRGIVFLWFGAIRKYKNVPKLLEQFARFENADATLVVAGAPSDPNEVEKILSAASADARVVLHAQRLTEEKLQLFVEAADVVVLPYSNILNSGSVIYALSIGRPSIVPNTPSFTELASIVGFDWIYLYDGDLDEKVLERAAQSALNCENERPDLSSLEWSIIAAEHFAFFEAIKNDVG